MCCLHPHHRQVHQVHRRQRLPYPRRHLAGLQGRVPQRECPAQAGCGQHAPDTLPLLAFRQQNNGHLPCPLASRPSRPQSLPTCLLAWLKFCPPVCQSTTLRAFRPARLSTRLYLLPAGLACKNGRAELLSGMCSSLRAVLGDRWPQLQGVQPLDRQVPPVLGQLWLERRQVQDLQRLALLSVQWRYRHLQAVLQWLPSHQGRLPGVATYYGQLVPCQPEPRAWHRDPLNSFITPPRAPRAFAVDVHISAPTHPTHCPSVCYIVLIYVLQLPCYRPHHNVGSTVHH